MKHASLTHRVGV